jgi:hypothetical protein
MIHILGGGTVFHVRPHLAVSAPAYGQTARWIKTCLDNRGEECRLLLTRMAIGGLSSLETNDDVRKLLDRLIADPLTKVIFMNMALCDFTGNILEDTYIEYAGDTPSGKDQPRLKSNQSHHMSLTPAEKLIGNIRKIRKDIFLVGFKTTAGETPDNQYFAGLNLLKTASCNLVLANDIHTRLNMVITPEQARYHETTHREEALTGLVEMALLRSKLTFTRSTVVPGNPVPWSSDMVPDSLRTVVDHCIARGAYKPFNGATVGHFAFKVDDNRFITSRRKVDFNKLPEIGMVLVEANGDDNVIAHGFRPSVGGQSQRIIFKEHPDVDCIVHAHVPLKPGAKIPVRSQREFECGSHQCGKNTSDGLLDCGDGVYAVMLDNHGPNVVFNRKTDPQKVIRFIEDNFDLTGRTDNVQHGMA